MPLTTQYTYDKLGRVDSILQANGVTSDYGYDSMDRVDLLTHFVDANNNHAFDSGETLLGSFDYAFNLDGSKSSVIEKNDLGQVTTLAWTYDSLNRLTSESYSGFDAAGASLSYRDTFVMDRTGNRLLRLHDDGTSGHNVLYTETSTYDANDRLLTATHDVTGTNVGDTFTTYQWGLHDTGTGQTQQNVYAGLSDDNSQLTSTTSYTYDARGRMSQSVVSTYATPGDASSATTITTAYAYDPSGIRVQQKVTQDGQPEETHDYLIDTNNPTGYQQVLEEKVNGLLQKTFTLAMDVVAQHDAGIPSTAPNGPADPRSLTLLYDSHGSTRAVLSLTREVIQRYCFAAYGETLGFQVATAATSLLYSGEWINGQGQGNLQYLRDRWMMPGVGRFTQEDNFERGAGSDLLGLNIYLFANGDPTNGYDPTGLFTGSAETAATVGIGQSILFALVLVGVAIGNSGVPSRYEAPIVNLATQLNTKIIPEYKLQQDEQNREPGYLYFVHGSSEFKWRGATGIDIDESRDNLDFGKGFYTFPLPDPRSMIKSIDRAFQSAGGRSTMGKGSGGVPFLMIVRTSRLLKKHA